MSILLSFILTKYKCQYAQDYKSIFHYQYCGKCYLRRLTTPCNSAMNLKPNGMKLMEVCTKMHQNVLFLLEYAAHITKKFICIINISITAFDKFDKYYQ